MVFFIKEKKEFLVIYSIDCAGLLTVAAIEKFFSTGKNKGLWDYIISQEKGHERGDVHTRFHVYLRYKGPVRNGFSCGSRNAERVWDIKLPMNYCKFIDIGGTVNYCLPGHCPVDDFEIYSEAHPNIKFEGDKIDPNCKNTFKMIDYVVKQKEEIKYRLNYDKIVISSNFDWEPLWKELKQKMKERLQLIEHDFCVWLRDLILNRNEMTRDEIEHAIIEHEKLSEMFLMKHYNYKTVLDSFFKVKPNVKPKPYWGTFFLPVELYLFCMKLDEWVKRWFDPNIKDKGSRPEGCFVSGRAKCGKN